MPKINFLPDNKSFEIGLGETITENPKYEEIQDSY